MSETPHDPHETPEPPRPDPSPAPGRAPLTRSRDDRWLAGVAGGIARHLGLDPLLVRLGLLALTLVGGAGAVLYLAAWLLVPEEGAERAILRPDLRESSTGRRLLTILLAAVVVIVVVAALAGPALALIPLAVLAVFGLGTWWLVSGQRPSRQQPRRLLAQAALGVAVLAGLAALAVGGFLIAGYGGQELIAGGLVLAGVALVASAFLRPARWLVLPGLALALGAAVPAAADIDLHGGYGERTVRPAQRADMAPSYRLGAGDLTVDLRRTRLAAGDTPLELRVGVGRARLLVAPGTCVVASGRIGAGASSFFGDEDGGTDVRVTGGDQASGRPRVVLDARVGVGAVEVSETDDDHGGQRGHSFGGPSQRRAGDRCGSLGG